MKKIFLSATVVFLTGFLSLQAQNLNHTAWKTYFGDPINDTISWHFEGDTSYVLGSHGDVFVRSHYKVVKDTLNISDYDGQYQCPAMDAKYTFTVSGSELSLVLVEDACQGRNAIAGIKWIRLKTK